MSETSEAAILNLARDMREVLLSLRKVVSYMEDAESEVPEKMRRFIMYMHDVHDVSNMYEERGLPVPEHIRHEMQRCDDRYRHLLEDGQADIGWLTRVRAEMTKRPGNRWDHGSMLPKPKETKDETGPSESGRVGIVEAGADSKGEESGEGGGYRDAGGEDEALRRRRPRL